MNFASLPGGEPVQAGLADAAAGLETLPSVLVSIGAPASAASASKSPICRSLIPSTVSMRCWPRKTATPYTRATTR
jgi:hypothetical protein